MLAEQNNSITRRQIEDRYLPRALNRIAEAMESDDEKLAFAAARWVAEMVLGKPRQELAAGTAGAELAAQFAQALRDALMERENALPPPEAPVIEGGVRILGSPVVTIIDDTDDFPDE